MNPSTAMAAVLVDELVRLGCRHAVLCPGSRSAPLAYALADAEGAGRLTLHVRIDERSAAFVALGLAKATGRPTPVVTTSGTAVAELHPAVLEASHGRIPLLLLTADRPPELRDTQANQTTDQVKVFGAAVRWQHDLGAPDRRGGQPAAWRTVVDRAWVASLGDLGGAAGPVHLNIPLRDPLAPDLGSPDDNAPAPGALAGRPDGRPWTRISSSSSSSSSSQVPSWWCAPAATGVEAVPDVPRTLVVLGDLGAPAATRDVLRLADALSWPVLAEPFGCRDAGVPVPHAPLVAAVPGLLDALAPQRILLVGRLSLTRTLAGLLRAHAAAGGAVELVTPGATWPDPGHLVSAVYPYAALTVRDQLGGGQLRTSADLEWYARWRRLGSAVAAAIGPALTWREGSPTGPALAASILAALPAGSRLFLGSSNAARDVDIARGVDELEVVANRGLAGIDGCVSTACGMALAGDAPTYALVGDLTFLHDANALIVGPGEPRPDLTVVVANDDGGGIFATLEYGEAGRERHLERIFTTPTGTDLAALAAAHGVPFRRVTEPAALTEALGTAPRGLRVVEVSIARGRHRAAYAALRRIAAEAARLPRPA